MTRMTDERLVEIRNRRGGTTWGLNERELLDALIAEREAYRDLQDENARLLTKWSDGNHRIGRLEAENERLRELCACWKFEVNERDSHIEPRLARIESRLAAAERVVEAASELDSDLHAMASAHLSPVLCAALADYYRIKEGAE